MKMKKTIYLVAQLVALIAIGAGIFFITEKQVNPTPVYQYSRAIPANTTLQSSDFQLVHVPKTAVNNSYIANLETVVGKAVNTDVFQGEYVLQQHISEINELNPLKSMDLSDYRKVVIPVDLTTGFAGMIKPGQTVDLVFVGSGDTYNESGKGTFTYTKSFMQSVIVYETVADNATPYVSQFDSVKQGILPTENTGDYAYLVLAVTQEQMLEILARQATGTVLAVGRFNDSTDKNVNEYVIGTPGEVNSGFTSVERR